MMFPRPRASDARLDALLLRQEVEDFNAAYAAALDEQRLTDWAEMFTDDAFYVVISRENADRGMPVGLIYCDSKRMIYDRAFALEKTAMFAPRYLRHLIGNLQILGEERKATSGRGRTTSCFRCCMTGRMPSCIRSAPITTCSAGSTARSSSPSAAPSTTAFSSTMRSACRCRARCWLMATLS